MSDFIVPVRYQEQGIRTGLAVQNADEKTVLVELTLLDAQGEELLGQSPVTIEIPARGHMARFVDELFSIPASPLFVGTLTAVVQSGAVAAIALEQGPEPGEFTTLPVAPLR